MMKNKAAKTIGLIAVAHAALFSLVLVGYFLLAGAAVKPGSFQLLFQIVDRIYWLLCFPVLHLLRMKIKTELLPGITFQLGYGPVSVPDNLLLAVLLVLLNSLVASTILFFLWRLKKKKFN